MNKRILKRSTSTRNFVINEERVKNTLENLHIDLKFNIFAFLAEIGFPRDGILRMNLVCKSWYAVCRVYRKWWSHAEDFYNKRHFNLKSMNGESLILYQNHEYILNEFSFMIDTCISQNQALLSQKHITRFKSFIGFNLCNQLHIWRKMVSSFHSFGIHEVTHILQWVFKQNYRRKEEWLHPFHLQNKELSLFCKTKGDLKNLKLLEEQSLLLWETHKCYLERLKNDPLALKNFHQRDFHIVFFDENDDHYYKVVTCKSWNDPEYSLLSTHYSRKLRTFEYDGFPHHTYGKLMSVTTFIHTLYDEFVEDAVIEDIMKSEYWPNSDYYEMTPEQIKLAWKANRDFGSKQHHNIENYYNGKPYERTEIEFLYFLRFEAAYIKRNKLKAYRTEMWIYDMDTSLVGAVDMLYEYADDEDKEKNAIDGKKHLIIVDWKFSKKIRDHNYHGKGGIAPPTYKTNDCNFMHYTIQLCLYKFILEKNYNFIIDAMYLVVLHRSQKTFKRLEVEWDEKFMKEIIAYRKSEYARLSV